MNARHSMVGANYHRRYSFPCSYVERAGYDFPAILEFWYVVACTEHRSFRELQTCCRRPGFSGCRSDFFPNCLVLTLGLVWCMCASSPGFRLFLYLPSPALVFQSTIEEKWQVPADLNPNKTQNNSNGNGDSNDPKSISCTRRRISGVPKGTPARQCWHVTRERVVKRVISVVFEGFRGRHGEGGGRRVVGLVGDSGSGKTTAASELVRGGVVRELFSDGVVWLNVGRGAKDRLRCLMHELASMVHEVVCCGKGRPPPAAVESSADGYSSAAYIREIMTGTATQGSGDGIGSGANGGGGGDESRGHHHRRCFLVADSVWEPEVIALLRETGMWLLVTTRLENLVRDAEGETVRLDKLSPHEGEAVLRGAAGIPAGVPLPDAARDLGELCGYVAMDLAYVGRWNSVCGRRDRLAWSDAEASIRMELDAQDYDITSTTTGSNNRTKLRAAVLRAGFDELGMEGPVVQWLYMALAVMPDSHAFSVMDAAVLLCDGECDMADVEFCRRVVDVLERLSIVRAEGSASAVSDMTCGWWQTHKYRMHAAHGTFARENLMDRADVLGPAVERWVRHISSEQAVREISPVVLVELWRAVKYVAGCGGSDEYFVADTGLSGDNTAGAAAAAAGAMGTLVPVIDCPDLQEHMEVHGLGNITNTRICSLAVQSAFRTMQFHAERQDWDCALTMWSRALDWVHTAETDKGDGTAALANGGSLPPFSPSASSSAEVVFEELVQLGWSAWEAGCEEQAVDMVKRGVAMGEARLGPANLDDALMARGGLPRLARFCELTSEGKRGEQPATPSLLQQQRQLQEEEEKAASSVWRRAGRNGSVDSPRSDPQTVQITLHQLAVGVWDTRRYEEAMSLLRRALENVPQSKAGGVASIGVSEKDVAVDANAVHDVNRWVQGTEGTE